MSPRTSAISANGCAGGRRRRCPDSGRVVPHTSDIATRLLPLQTRIQELKKERSGEDVFFLPGKIPISRLRQLRKIETSGEDDRGLMTQFMVRGHWRRANPDWHEQRLRWIEPYWKGPELATVIEREYRMKP